MRTRRAVTMIAALTLLLGLAPAASAHAELGKASPEPGSELDEAPPEIRISFTGELDPGASGFVLTGPDGSELASGVVDLEVAERNELHAPVTITEPGTYTVEWTAVAADGHRESGRFTFGYRSESVEQETPDTALGRPGTPAAMLGGLLLALATVMALVRGAARAWKPEPMRRALAVMPVALLLAACVEDTRPQGEACDAPTIEVALTLSEDGLQPASPYLCRDQEVTLAITSSVDGVIHIHGYDEWVPATEVVAGDDLEMTFVAERSGQFPIELHPADDPQGVELGVFTVHEP